MERLNGIIARILPLDETAMNEAAQHLDSLTKPQGSLGKLEAIARQLAGITGERTPDLGRKAVIVMAADHGVCEEGVSAFPSAVTAQMVLNFLHGGACVNVLARHAGADVVCVDIGVDADLEHPGLYSRKVRRGTRNLRREPAMTREEALAAVLAGCVLVQELAAKGYRLFATGEMGIGNTTASAALFAALTGIDAEEAVGRGTGIGASQRELKVAVVRDALRLHAPSPHDPFTALAKLGGLDIAGLVGVILGAAATRSAVVIDGFISTAAALVAVRLCPQAADFMIASHVSQEKGHARLLQEAGLMPALTLEMRLGEGTGAVLMFHLIEAAERVMREMATFESAGVSRE